MTIKREYRNGPFVVQCDECTDTKELEGTDLMEAVQDSKERGFTPVFDGQWYHHCRSCSK